MISARPAITAALGLVISLTPVTFRHQAATQPAAAAKEPEYVEEKGFKGKVFELKHRDPSILYSALRPLGSGFKGATMSVNQELKTITVRDFPENIAAIEEAIKRLDAPEAARPSRPPSPDIEFHIHILIASSTGTPPGELPADLGDVVKQLQSTLRYKSYGLMASSIHRAREGGPGVSNSGVAESKLFDLTYPQGNPIFFNYALVGIALDPDATGAPRVQVRDFKFGMRIPLSTGSQIQYENVGFTTPVSFREGDKVVVGTTTMGDKGLVVVVLARVIK